MNKLIYLIKNLRTSGTELCPAQESLAYLDLDQDYWFTTFDHRITLNNKLEDYLNLVEYWIKPTKVKKKVSDFLLDSDT